MEYLKEHPDMIGLSNEVDGSENHFIRCAKELTVALPTENLKVKSTTQETHLLILMMRRKNAVVLRRKNAAVMRRKKVPEMRTEAPLMKIRPRISIGY